MGELEPSITVGRYQLHRAIARGGMATIHIAHLIGDVGFSRIVAAKRLLPELAQDREFVAMFLDEARIASKVHHRNVVPVLDVVTMSDEVILVQDYVHGVPLSWLQKALFEARTRIPIPIAVSIACQTLAGLHAAHETTDELGTPLEIVHRDVSPQNVMIAADGTARLLDFGVAKAAMAMHVTRAGMFKGKIGYAAPEQIRGRATRQSDVYAVAVVLWELLAGRRLHPSSLGQSAQIERILRGALPRVTEALSEERAWLGDDWRRLEEVQQVLDRGLTLDPKERWATAIDMEAALVAAVTPAPAGEVATWLRAAGKLFLDEREHMIANEEADWRRLSAAIPRAATTADLRANTTAEQPPIVATEPPPPAQPAPRIVRPLALIAACAVIGVVLAFGIAFLGRDLEPPRPTAALAPKLTTPGDHTVARPQPSTVAPRAVAPPATIAAPAPLPPRVTVPTRAPLAPARAAPLRPAAKKVGIERAPPPRAPPAAGPSSCSPPYYFAGDKKIFKASCL
ncbi:MAG: protein kinase [Myxococcales bacterium]|nr:protein kinase [Myxococcales bacterium]